ncbi:MAG: dihydropteroate synthase [Chlorobi bacterium]|nr:dihydropteroate synthase [Chlorobiota bacterium]MCI0715136.1 dihydropteroate synthase [Chlorobiota bacterium]
MNDNFSYQFGKKVYDLSSRTFVMGVLNVTPDSFSDGGKYFKPEDAIAHAKQMESEGADFIDVGGQSTRPGAEEVSQEEEFNRVIPVIKSLVNEVKIPISIDTYRSEVAEEALKNGALIVNDISGFNFDKNMAPTVAKHKASAIIMHIKGTPKDMQLDPQYNDLIGEIIQYFENAAWKANVEGIKQIIIDPGIGFGKTVEHNLKILKHLGELKRLDSPIMVGISRKSLIGKLTNTNDVNDRLEGTVALNSVALLNGAHIIRVHDVKAGVRTARVLDAYRNVN